ncbi:4148_t:CDS:2, partial [Acaulospora colombiana]
AKSGESHVLFVASCHGPLTANPDKLTTFLHNFRLGRQDGGFSGLPALLLLDQIFHRIIIDLGKDIKPCEYFDMIVGTGPGGMEMTVEDAISACNELEGCMPQRGQSVTEEERVENTVGLRRGLETLMSAHGLGTSELMQRHTGNEPRCRTNGSQIHLIKSYENRGVKSPRCGIIEAGLAAVAASDTFPPVTISKAYRLNVGDASSMCPNPSIEAIKEATKVFGLEKKVASILSIGGELATSHVIPVSDSEKLRTIFSQANCTHDHIQSYLPDSKFYTRLMAKHKCLFGSQDTENYCDMAAYVQEKAIHRLIDDSIKPIHQKDWRESQVEIKASPSQSFSALRADDAMKIDTPTVLKFEDRPESEILSETEVSLEEEIKKLDRLRQTPDTDKEILSSLSRVATLSHRLGKHKDAIQYEMMVMMQHRGDESKPETREYLQSASAVAFYESEAGELKKACERGEEVLKKQK